MYRDLAQDQDQIVDDHEVSVELKSSAEEGEVGDSFVRTQQKSYGKWSNVAKIAVMVLFFFITGEVLCGAVTRIPQLQLYVYDHVYCC